VTTAPILTVQALGVAANRRRAASSVAPATFGYERALRPCPAWFSPSEDVAGCGGDR